MSTDGIDPPALYSMFKADIERKITVLLFEEKDLIATAQVEKRDVEGIIMGVVVRDDHQRKGFGSRLMKYTLGLMLLEGLKTAILEVKVENVNAIRFYKRLGFRIENRKESLYKMVKDL
jgi:ribosomal-protein-alanine N-acetyltransferase